MSSGPSTLKKMWPLDPNMRELIESLWREYYGLYAEKYNRDPEKWLLNKFSEDIDFGQVLGQDHLIEGNRSAAFGQGLVTKSFLEQVFGTHNLIPEGQNPTEWILTDLLMSLGNGKDDAHRSNVFEIFKSGLFYLHNAIRIGNYDHRNELGGLIPAEDGTLRYTIDGSLEIWEYGKWNRFARTNDLSAYTTIDYVTEVLEGVIDYLEDGISTTVTWIENNFSTGAHIHTWTEITEKPTFAPVATSGSYIDLINKPSIPDAQVNADWNAVAGVAVILNKPSLFDGTWNSLSGKPTFATVATSGNYTDLSNRPTIPAAQVNSDWNAVAGVAVILNKPALFSGSYTDLTNKPSLFDGTWNSLSGKPTFATVATTGSYTDLSNKPSIPDAQVNSDWNAVAGVAVILNKPSLFSGSYTDLTNKPSLFDGTWNSLSGKPTFATVATTGSYTDLSNKPTIPDAQVNSDWNAVAGVAVILNKPSLFSGSYTDLTNKPSLFDGTWNSLSGKPTFATVATTGSYTDLSNKPTIPAAQINSDWNAVTGVAMILNKPTLFSGSYTDLTNKPALFDGTWTSLSGKPTFATVATTGSYTDLSNKPNIPDAQVNADWNATTGVAVILNKPTIPSLNDYATIDYVTEVLEGVIDYFEDGISTTVTWIEDNYITRTVINNIYALKHEHPYLLLEGGTMTGAIIGLVAPTIKLTDNATEGYFWKCTSSDGSGMWHAVATAQVYKGTWVPGTNTPDITAGSPVSGWYYRVTAAGTWNGITFNEGDDVQYNGTVWQRIPGGYILQIATPSVLGGVKIGSGISIDATGLISVSTNYQTPITTGTTAQYFRGDLSLATFPTLFDGTWTSLSGKPSFATVATSGSYTDLSNKPTIPAAQVNSDWAAVAGVAMILNKPTLFSGSYTDLTNKPALFDGTWTSLSGKPTFATVAISGSYADLTNKPSLFDGTWTSLTGKPSFATVATSGSYTDLTNKPSIPAAQVNSDWNAVAGVAVILNKPALFSGSYTDLTNKPSLFDGTWTSLTGKPSFATVATSGSYTDLTNKPSIPAAQVNADWSAVAGVAVILNKPTLFSGSYTDLTNKPSLFDGTWTSLTGKPSFATVATSGSYTDLTNKPSIPAAQVNADWSAVAGVAVILNKPTLFSGSYTDLTNKPSLFDGTWTSLTGKPTFATVATSGSYTDLTNKPSIPAAQVNADWSAVAGVAVILNKPTLFSGSYTDLSNKPTIPAAQVNSDWNATTGVASILNKPNFEVPLTFSTGLIRSSNVVSANFGTTHTTVAYGDHTHSLLYAPISGSGNYVRISPASAQTGNIWLTGGATYSALVNMDGGFYAAASSLVASESILYFGNPAQAVGVGIGYTVTDGLFKLKTNEATPRNIATFDALTLASVFGGSVTAESIIKQGGTSSQFLKADGSVDTSSYSVTGHTHDYDNYGGWNIVTEEFGSAQSIASNSIVSFNNTDAIAFSKVASGNIAYMYATLRLYNLPAIVNADSTYYIPTISPGGVQSKITIAQLQGLIGGGGSYTLPLAANGTRGGIQIGYAATGANVPLQLSAEKAFVALTKAAIEAVLTGQITTHTHPAGEAYILTKAAIEEVFTGAITSHTHNYDNYGNWVIETDQYLGSQSVNSGQVILFKNNQAISFEQLSVLGKIELKSSLAIHNLTTITNPTTDNLIAITTTAGVHSNISLATLKALIDTVGSNYSLPLAANGTRGGIQIGYIANSANLALQLSAEEKAFVALTKAAIEAELTGIITTHTHNDALWTDVGDFTYRADIYDNISIGKNTNDGDKLEVWGNVKANAFKLGNFTFIQAETGELKITKTGSTKQLIWNTDDSLYFNGTIKGDEIQVI